MGRGRYPPPPPEETSFDLCGQDTNRPTDASGAFRSGPRAPTEAVTPFFQNSKLIQNEKFKMIKFLPMNLHFAICNFHFSIQFCVFPKHKIDPEAYK
jgi:hypothetical protein